MKKKYVFIIICLFSLVGCVNQKVLENLGLIIAVGYDKDGEKVKGKVITHHFGQKTEQVAEEFEGEGFTVKGFRKDANYQVSNRLVSGQLRVAIFNQELAKDGIITYVESLIRDASTQANLYLAISEGSARELLDQKKFDKKGNVGIYIYQMIQQNVKAETMVESTIHNFARDHYEIGQDSILPIIKQTKNGVSVDGIAMMRRGKMKFILPEQYKFYLGLMREGFQKVEQEMELPFEPFKKHVQGEPKNETFHIMLNQFKAKPKIKVIKEKPITFQIDIDAKVGIFEVTEKMVIDEKLYPVLEKEIAKEIKKNVEGLLANLQEEDCDPIGFGSRYNAHKRGVHLTNDMWYKMYKDVKFKVNTKVEILRNGVLN
ncbi:Ger(x)C family spore germination protein [Priestia taiwanensis]|uniref:Germination protein GerHC n=1 Tax=Priestia taiwanensis TaxID=1347902 RepID=A0A917ALN6_9BACI|nr:Ger(x)C family spore germination protein [Priestia taiwanensis]MBM7362081.1 spore germination protein [Priestia taiwanensis]GGE59305.1 germination protein GerHC [Priestia taiwanensis]